MEDLSEGSEFYFVDADARESQESSDHYLRKVGRRA